MYNTFSLTLTHTRDRSSEDCIHTYLGTRCARTRCNATTNAKIKKETKKKTISTSASPLSSIRRRSTKKKKNATTRNGSGETETSFRTLMESRTRSSKLFTYRCNQKTRIIQNPSTRETRKASNSSSWQYSRWSWIVIGRRSLVVGGGWCGRCSANTRSSCGRWSCSSCSGMRRRGYITWDASITPSSWSWILKAARCLSIAFRWRHNGSWSSASHSSACRNWSSNQATTIAAARSRLMLRDAVIIFVSTSINVAIRVTRSIVTRRRHSPTIATVKRNWIFEITTKFKLNPRY